MRSRRGAVVLAAVAWSVLGMVPGAGAGATPSASDGERIVSRDMRGRRYCEVLLVTPTEGGIVADVYNSYPLNECPQDQWEALDTAAIAAEQGVPAAILNGPRYWLMDRVVKLAEGEPVTATFGEIAMTKQATVNIGSPASAIARYAPVLVDRSTIFTFTRGSTVYELLAADGERYVMQTWSQQVDPTLVEADLAAIGDRLQLPEGWTYRARELRKPLRVVTTTTKAAVLQDDLGNSYSRTTG